MAQRQWFKSKVQGMNTRKHRWLCQDCEMEWIIREKKRECPFCASKAVAYFPSDLEYKRYCQLALYAKIGQISNLTLQPTFPIEINGTKITSYRADFMYTEDGARIVEDCKGLETDVFIMKKKLVFAIHGVTITVVKKV